MPRRSKQIDGLPQVAIKRSVTIAGHPTSIRIETLFWDVLLAEAERRGLPVNALIADIDVWRLASSEDDAPNLASAIRQWAFLQGAKTVDTPFNVEA